MRTTHLLSRLVSSLNEGGSRSRQQRTLRMESLEPRWVFSAAPVAGGECTPVLEFASGEAELVAPLPSVGPTYPVIPGLDTELPLAPQQLTTPVATQQAFIEYADRAEGEDAARPESEDVFHIDMTSSYQGNGSWTFSGTVGTIANRSGVKVTFGGLLSGHSTAVNKLGQFSYTHNFGLGIYGNVTGKANDLAGNSTNTDTEFIAT